MPQYKNAIISVLIVATLMVFTLTARAESNLPRPFAPWMALEDHVTTKHPIPRSKGLQQNRALRKMAAPTKTPEHPVITPEDTLALIDQIYNANTQPSPLEKSYSRRIIEDLHQFGYDLFGTKETDNQNNNDDNNNAFALPAGAVQDDFLLNIGDRINITFRGQRQDSKTYTITSTGQLLIDDLSPISVSGRSIGMLRDVLEAETESMHNTQVFVSLESVQQVNVLVVGHVKQPGRQTMTVFHTVLDALMAAGGVDKAGSLRQIKLVREGRSTIIDLYALLIHGSAIMDISLRDGDRIIIPTIGPTVAVGGSVKRPGIYEILPDKPRGHTGTRSKSQKLNLEDVLNLAGGLLNLGQNRFIKLGLTSDGREAVDEIMDPRARVFSDGTILMVAPSDEMRAGTVELLGETRQTGLHALAQTPTLSALLNNEKVFGPDIYPLIGIIERRDGSQLTREMISFPPLLVLKEKFDRRLQDGDIVHLFSRTQIMNLPDKKKEEAKKEKSEPKQHLNIAQDDEINDPVIASFLRERAAFVRGAVRAEGSWPVADGATLDNLLAVSGGLALEANTSNIEVTSKLQGENGQEDGRSGTRRIAVNFHETNPDDIMIGPGDSIRVNQKFHKISDNSVLIIGEVAHPGRYDIMPGDKMSDLLQRAGSLTSQAYPDGAIFSRENERRGEEARFQAQAQELELRLAAALNQEKEPDEGKIYAVQELVTQLKNAEALGRITVEADPGMLSVQPELDILLESGDRIYIPKRPLTVRVAGEVLSPASLQFRKNKDARDYIMEAGGFAFDADKDRTFVIYPDGSAQPLLVNNWNHTPAMIPPGSTVIVPRDPKPFDFIQTAKDVSQILSNLAITGIFLDDIRTSN